MTTRKKHTGEPTTNGGHFGTLVLDAPAPLGHSDARIEFLGEYDKWAARPPTDLTEDFDTAQHDYDGADLLSEAVTYLPAGDEFHDKYVRWTERRNQLMGEFDEGDMEINDHYDDATTMLDTIATRLRSPNQPDPTQVERLRVLSRTEAWEERRVAASESDDEGFDWAGSDDKAVELLGQAMPHLPATEENTDLRARFATWETERERLSNDDDPRHSDWEHSDDDAVELLSQVAARIEP